MKTSSSQQLINNRLIEKERESAISSFLKAKHRGIGYFYQVEVFGEIIGKDTQGNLGVITGFPLLIKALDHSIIVKQGKFTAKLPIMSNRINKIEPISKVA